MKTAHVRMLLGTFLVVTTVAFLTVSASLPINASPSTSLPLAAELRTTLNADRAARNLNPLIDNGQLDEAAAVKAETLLAEGWFDHTTKDGRTPWDFIRAAGYQYSEAGENLAIDFTTADAIESAWLASAAHRANLLDPSYQDLGIAAIPGQFNHHSTILVVELFAAPDTRTPLERAVDRIIETGSALQTNH